MNDAWMKSIHAEVNPFFISDPFPRLGDEITVKLRMIRTDEVLSVHLRRLSSGRRVLLRMPCREDGPFVHYEARVKIDQPRVTWHFILETRDDVVFFNRRGTLGYPPTEDDDFVILADLAVPRWVASTVFYSIVPDRFHRCPGAVTGRRPGDLDRRGHRTVVREWHERPLSWDEGGCLDFFNGDLDGIAAKLNYLKGLGIGAILMTPIFPALSNHRYDVVDFSRIDPALGGDEALIRMTRALHCGGVRVVLDITMNHTSREHSWFTGAAGGVSDGKRGFYCVSCTGEEHEYWADNPEYPKLNYSSPRVRDVMYRDAESSVQRFLREPFAIDGWRFDVGHETGNHMRAQLGHSVFSELRQITKSINPECYLLGEHPKDSARFLQGDAWDAAMNYFGCYRPLRWFAGELDYYQRAVVGHPSRVRKRTARELGGQLRQYLQRIPDQLVYFQYNLLDSHDGPRFHNTALYSPELYRALLIILFLLPGAPAIYYGDEVGIAGGTSAPEDFRYPMPWDPRAWDATLFGWYRKLARLKSTEPALQLGSCRFLHEDAETLAFCRFSDRKVFVAAAHNGDTDKSVELDLWHVGKLDREAMTDVFSLEKVDAQGGRLRLRIPPKSGALLEGTLQP